MHSRALARFAPLMVIAAGCETAGPPLEPPTDLAANVTPAGVIASASGSAHRIRSDEIWVLSFNAEKRADGTTTGQVRMDRKDVNVSLNIDVTCMSVSGNIAWIAGIIRNQSGNIAIDGTISYFYVIDNGEGSDAPPDVAPWLRRTFPL